jgi:hypothetical protein
VTVSFRTGCGLTHGQAWLGGVGYVLIGCDDASTGAAVADLGVASRLLGEAPSNDVALPGRGAEPTDQPRRSAEVLASGRA